MYHAVCTADSARITSWSGKTEEVGIGTHGEPCNGVSTVPVGKQLTRGAELAIQPALSRNFSNNLDPKWAMYVNLLKYRDCSCLLAYCLGLGMDCCSSHLQLYGCTLNRVVHLHTSVLKTGYSQQKLDIKMLDKTMGQLTKHAKKLWKSVEIKYEGPRTEGQEC